MTNSNDSGKDQQPSQESQPVSPFDSVISPKSKRTSSSKSRQSSTNPVTRAIRAAIGQTPQKASSGHLGALSNRGLTTSEGTSLRRNEKYADFKERLVDDTACVVSQAQPRSAWYLSLAQTLTERVSASVEHQIASSNVSDGDVFGNEPLPAVQPNEHARTFLPWIHMKDKRSGTSNTEKDMYPMVSAFILYVAQVIQNSGVLNYQAGLNRCRLILPFEKTDTLPGHSDSSERVDIELCCKEVGSPIERQNGMDYQSLFALVEAKRGRTKADFASAYSQLFAYSEKMYFYQIDRRFLWGVVCCGTIIKACVFSNYNVHASPDIDISELDGRREFVRLLVGWSLCEWDRLGYDPTITNNSELGCYEVKVPKKDNHKDHTIYYCDDSVVGAQREVGRHCRCLLATPVKPTARMPKGEKLHHTVVVKDSWTAYNHPKDSDDQQLGSDGKTAVQDDVMFSWPQEGFVPVEDARHEVRLLKIIKSGLSGAEELVGTYPEIQDGGWVYLPLDTGPGDTTSVIDSTREIISGLDEESQKDVPFCLHMRCAMTPIGKRLRDVRSVPEQIIVLYDAMNCHFAIQERCGILHRDISDNNILVVRQPGKPVRGMLIDFDCAIDTSVERSTVRPERTGTQPFMSIANLEQMQIKRSVLDDWESLLYLVCWVGTYGINRQNPGVNEDAAIPIRKWRGESSFDIGSEKRNSLASVEAFENQILNNFYREQEGWEMLRFLAKQLHQILFFNKQLNEEPRRYHGTIGSRKVIQAPFHDHVTLVELAKMDLRLFEEEFNPFKERLSHASAIAKELLDEFSKFAAWARGETSR